jgi:hypothetical protein
MKPPRDLLLANGAALVLLLVVLIIGWRFEAAFGLAVLVILNLLVLLRGRPGGPKDEGNGG